MKVKLIKPKSKILQNYIAYFYIYKRSHTNEDETFLVFPNIYTMVSVFKDVKITFDKYSTLIQYQKNTFSSILDIKYITPLVMTYRNSIDEIAIAFKPLGINAFLEHDLDYYLTEYIHTYPFIPYEDYNMLLENIFLKNDDEKIDMLESYLLTKLKNFTHPFLQEVLTDITTVDLNDPSLIIIAKKYNITTKTLSKHFKKHLGKTPANFRKIVRFRQAMDTYKSKQDFENLTDIAFDNKYFDQSHMIRDFKALTKKTPKDFFKSLNISADGNINIIFLKEG